MKKTYLLISLLLVFALSGMAQAWEKINTGFNYILKGIEFPAGQSQIGFAGGESLTYMGDGIVIKTTNAGTSWTQLWTGTQKGIEGISFPDMNTGYVCGWSAYFAKSTNGGVSWTPQTPGTDIYYYTDVVFKDAAHGIVAAQTNTGMAVYSTSDGGNTWTEGNGLAAVPYKLCYVTGDTYFLVTNSGAIQKSTDNGLTWATIYSAGGLLTGIDFYNPLIGMAASEDGRIVKTYDGGVTWTQQVMAGAYPLWHDFAWANQNDVFVVGTPEQIYKSSDGGTTWVDDYSASTFDPALYEILFTPDGIGYICGSQGWFYRRAPQLTAAFTSNATTVCNGGNVQFTDQSIGSPTSWNWTFPGGNPSSSTLQNPLVTYPAAGVYDVTLVVTKGVISNTLVKTGLIHVEAPVAVSPSQPSGPAAICGSFNYDYTTSAVPLATSYSWMADPASAGTISGSGITGTLSATNTWEGAFTIRVAAANSCGSGPVSAPLNVVVSHQPNVFSLFAGGGYCNGQNGYEVKLDDSDPGVDYQLFKDGTASGATVPGTGNSLSFGNHTTGNYTVTGSTASCFAIMQGIATIYIIDLPAAASQPVGPAAVCSNSTSTYTAVLPYNGYSLVWTLNPPEAGTITQPNTATAVVTWAAGFTGPVSMTVQGQNECGTGAESGPLPIVVNAIPVPAITGENLVCKAQVATYIVQNQAGSSFIWTISGGAITSGQGTSQVSVLWGNPGPGSVAVAETAASGCIGNSALFQVTIDVCTGLPHVNADEFTIYPNPATTTLNIVFPLHAKGLYSISVFNHLGQMVSRQTKVSARESGVMLLDISSFLPGIYTIVLSSETGIQSRVFVKE